MGNLERRVLVFLQYNFLLLIFSIFLSLSLRAVFLLGSHLDTNSVQGIIKLIYHLFSDEQRN